MRVPISWVKEFVPINLPVEEIAKYLTFAGIEVAAIESIGAFNSHIVVGEVIEYAPLENKPDLHRVLVNVGKEQIEIVSGAPNITEVSAGTKVATALPGAIIFDGSASGYRIQTVTPVRIYDVQSMATLCSEKELGVGKDNTGVLILDPETKIGRPVIEYLGPSQNWDADEVLILEILANIARCHSIIGVAREIAALTKVQGNFEQEFANYIIKSGEINPIISVPKLCKRFSTALIDGIQVTDSPAWMQRRLVLSGLEPVNNVVDTINYVMIELGQPMHAYDADLLPSSYLEVRFSHEGEHLHTLGQENEKAPVSLPDDILVIASDDKPVAIAGLIGGLETSIRKETSRIQIESANFDFISIRKSQRVLNIYTEASARFSRGVDPSLTIPGILRVLKLLEEICPNLRFVATGDVSHIKDEALEIDLTLAEVNNSLGMNFTLQVVADLLRRVNINCSVDDSKQMLHAIVTSSRQDIKLPADLIEEVARLHGYDQMPATMPIEPIPMHPPNRHLEVREAARDAMVRWGLQEIISYTLTNPNAEKALFAGHAEKVADYEYIRLLNPISSERTVMRRNLIPGLLQAIHDNLRYTDACHLFEIGVIILPEEKSDLPLLPVEPYRLAIAMTGPIEISSLHRKQCREVDYYDIKNVICFLFDHLHIKGIEFEAADAPPFQPRICAQIIRDGKIYGHLGKIHPLVAATFDLEGRNIFCADLDLEAIIADSVRFFTFQEPSRFPSIELDIAVIVPDELPAKVLTDLVGESKEYLIQDVLIFDEYIGPPIPKNHKSIALRLNLNAGNRTLTQDEARSVRERIVKLLHEKLGAIVRE